MGRGTHFSTAMFAGALEEDESPHHPEGVGFNLINTTQKGVDACISSRITTVIQIVRDYQINYN